MVSLSSSCGDACLNAFRLIAPFAEGCARTGVRAMKLHHLSPPPPPALHLCSFAVPVHFGDRIPPSLAHPPFRFPRELSPGISSTKDVMLPSLFDIHMHPYWPVISSVRSRLVSAPLYY